MHEDQRIRTSIKNKLTPYRTVTVFRFSRDNNGLKRRKGGKGEARGRRGGDISVPAYRSLRSNFLLSLFPVSLRFLILLSWGARPRVSFPPVWVIFVFWPWVWHGCWSFKRSYAITFSCHRLKWWIIEYTKIKEWVRCKDFHFLVSFFCFVLRVCVCMYEACFIYLQAVDECFRRLTFTTRTALE